MKSTLAPTREPWRRKLLGIALALTFYAALACLLTWPLAAHLRTDLLGRSDDTPLHYWNSWWVQQALRHGANPWYTPYLFFPAGASLVTHNIAWANALIWAGLEPFTGGIAAYNIALLANLAACGCATYWLAHRLTGDRRAALLAGIIDQAWPYRLSQLGHPNLLATYWIPVFLLFLLAVLERRRWRDAALCGLAFALVGYTRWQQLIPAGALAAIILAWRIRSWAGPGARHTATRLLLAGIVGAALLAPAAVMLYQQQRSELTAADLLREEEAVMQTDVMAYVTPWSSHPLLGKYTQRLYDQYYHDRDGRRAPAYLGVVAIALALIGLTRRLRASLPWLAMALALMALALGPVLRVNGKLYDNIPMPYRLLEPLELFRLMREPDRYNVFLGLPVSILAAFGLRAAIARLRRPSASSGALLAGALGALVVAEYLAIPIPLWRIAAPPAFFSQMASEPSGFAVVNVPFDPLKSKIYMFDQVSHHHPILEGHISRAPANAYQYIDANPWLSKLRQTQEMAPVFNDVTRQLGYLARDGVRYLILHKNLVGANRVFHWRRYLPYAPRYEDERLAIYATAPQAGRDFALRQEMVAGLGPIERVLSSECTMAGRPLELDVAWGAAIPPGRDYDVLLTLVRDTGVSWQSERFPLAAGWASRLWPANTIAWGYYALTLAPWLAPGQYDIRLDLLDAQTGQPIGSPHIAATVAIRRDPCQTQPPEESYDIRALYGDVLCLRAVKLRQKSSTLDVTLYWRSLQRMGVDYKVFVHVFDRATGAPVAQDDAMPLRWSYPTTLWWPGEEIKDRFSISLRGAPPGKYGVAVGVYDAATGTRLTIQTQQGAVTPDGRLVLDAVVDVK